MLKCSKAITDRGLTVTVETQHRKNKKKSSLFNDKRAYLHYLDGDTRVLNCYFLVALKMSDLPLRFDPLDIVLNEKGM